MAHLDANVLIRHLVSDNSLLSPRATSMMRRVELGEVTIEFAETTLFEVAFTLERSYKQSKTQVAQYLSSFLRLPAVKFPEPRRALVALDIFERSNIDFGDAYVAALALESDGQVISFDRDFDRIPGVTRVEP